MDAPIKLGIWGVGSFANITARAIKASSKIQLVNCLCRTAEKADAFSQEFGCTATTNQDEFLATPGMEAVAVFTPNDLHAEHAKLAAARKLHIFMEKPMANTVEECRRMLADIEAAGVVMMLGHNTRRENRFRRIKALIDSGEVGKPVLGQIAFTSEAGLGRQLGGWRYDPKRTPAVGLIQIGVHALDLAYYFFGLPKCISARLTPGGMGPGFLDACTAWIEYESGLVLTFNNSYAVPRARSIEIMGTQLNLLSPQETLIKIHGLHPTPPREETLTLNNTLLEEYEEFADVVRGRKAEPETSALGGMHVVAMMEAVLRSSEENRPIHLKELLDETPRA